MSNPAKEGLAPVGRKRVRNPAMVADPAPGPLIVITSPVEGQQIVHGDPVVAQYSCHSRSDVGLASCEGSVGNGEPVDTMTLGANEFTVTAVDNNGSSFTTSVSYEVLDRTGPTVNIVTPADGVTYEQDEVVLADFTCTDPLSGMASCEGTVPNGSPVDTSSLGSGSFTVTATDNSGNTTVVTHNFTIIEPVFPVVTITVPADSGDYEAGTSVLADFECSDARSGIASCVGTVDSGQPFDTSWPGPHSFTVTATSNEGRVTEEVVNYTLSDTVDPAVVITTPANGASFDYGEVVLADFACTDTGSGMASCVGDVADGNPIDTSTLGPGSFSVTATDNAGNITVVTHNYTVNRVTPDGVLLDGDGDYVSSPDPSDLSLVWMERDGVTTNDHCFGPANMFDTALASTSLKVRILMQLNDVIPAGGNQQLVRTNGGELSLTIKTDGTITAHIDLDSGARTVTSADVLATEASLSDLDAVWLQWEFAFSSGDHTFSWSTDTDITDPTSASISWTAFTSSPDATSPITTEKIKSDHRWQLTRGGSDILDGKIMSFAYWQDGVLSTWTDISNDASGGVGSWTGGDGGTWEMQGGATTVAGVGSQELYVLAAADDWTPAANETLAGHWNPLGQSSRLVLMTTGVLRFNGSTNGFPTQIAVDSTAPTVTNGVAKWLKATRDWATGDVAFFQSDDLTLTYDSVSWSAIGTGSDDAGPLFKSNADWTIGAIGDGTVEFAGKVFAAAVLSTTSADGSSVEVVDADFKDVTYFGAGEPSGTDATGNVWTLQGDAVIDSV